MPQGHENINANLVSAHSAEPQKYQPCIVGFWEHMTSHSPKNTDPVIASLWLGQVRNMFPGASIVHVKKTNHSQSQRQC